MGGGNLIPGRGLLFGAGPQAGIEIRSSVKQSLESYVPGAGRSRMRKTCGLDVINEWC